MWLRVLLLSLLFPGAASALAQWADNGYAPCGHPRVRALAEPRIRLESNLVLPALDVRKLRMKRTAEQPCRLLNASYVLELAIDPEGRVEIRRYHHVNPAQVRGLDVEAALDRIRLPMPGGLSVESVAVLLRYEEYALRADGKAAAGEPPLRLALGPDWAERKPGEPAGYPTHVRLEGFYADEGSKALSLDDGKTRFRSSVPAVVAVDAQGRLTPGKEGFTQITAEREGLRADWLLPVPWSGRWISAERTDGALVQPGAVRRLREGVYVQVLAVTNVSDMGWQGMVHLVFEDLPEGVYAAHPDDPSLPLGNLTRKVQPLGSPYVILYSQDSHALWPGQVAKGWVLFGNPQNKSIQYRARVFSGPLPGL